LPTIKRKPQPLPWAKQDERHVVWCALTAVVLWPLTRRWIEFFNTNPAIQATLQPAQSEWDAELHEEFPEFYAKKQENRPQEEAETSTVPSP